MPALCFSEDYTQIFPTHVLEGTDPQPKVEWQDTLSSINARVQTLLQENDLLMKEYESLRLELNDIQYKVNEQKRKNIEWLDKSRSFAMPNVEEQAGELRRLIKEKQKAMGDRQKDVTVLNKKISVLEKKVEAKNFKLEAEKERERVLKEKEASQASQRQQEIANLMSQKEASLSDEIAQSKAKLEENVKREENTRREIESMQSTTQAPSADEIAQWQKDNESLQNQIASLEKEKIEKQKNALRPALSDERFKQKKEYLLALKDKTALEAQVVNLESELKVTQVQGSGTPISWVDAKRQSIEQIRNMDTANDRLREQIINLKENIYILKDKISRVEDRARIKDAVNERKKTLKKYQNNSKYYKYR